MGACRSRRRRTIRAGDEITCTTIGLSLDGRMSKRTLAEYALPPAAPKKRRGSLLVKLPQVARGVLPAGPRVRVRRSPDCGARSQGIAMAKKRLSAAPGTVIVVEHASPILADNPLGDPRT